MRMHPLLLLIALGSACSSGRSQKPALPVTLKVEDALPWHVHRPGKPFRVTVTATPARPTSARLFAQWVDVESRPLGDRVPLRPGKRRVLAAPAAAAGYCGLVFLSDAPDIAFPPQAAGFASEEFGFALLPPPSSRTRPDRRFGMVHADVLVEGKEWDPYLRGLQTKTMTWSVDAAEWRRELESRQRSGVEELPIVADALWDSDGKTPIPEKDLAAFAAKFRSLAAASPLPEAFEFGVEENLGGRFAREPFYLRNLAAKLGRIRKLCKRPFVYNLEGFEYEDHEALLRSPAAAHIDVLSSHPYRWPDFPAPEGWLPAHIRQLRRIMNAAGRPKMPLWLTEIGIPVRGNRDPRGFFGYPEDGNQVPGASRADAARYLVRCNVLALAHGVERVFTYNYQNRGKDRTSAEDHFGLRSYQESPHTPGFPLPSYVAFATMTDTLYRRPLVGVRHTEAGLWCAEFRGVLVVWHTDAKPQRVRYGALRPRLQRSDIRAAWDLFRRRPALPASGMLLDHNPIFLVLRSR